MAEQRKIGKEFIDKNIAADELNISVEIFDDEDGKLVLTRKDLKKYLSELGYGGKSLQQMENLLKKQGVVGEQFAKRQRIIKLIKEKIELENKEK